MNFIFFGTPDIAVDSLEALKAAGLLPRLIVTAPDKARGRGLELTPSEAKSWGHAHAIPVLTPERLKDESFLQAIAPTQNGIEAWDVCVVVAYGKIIPQIILDMPRRGIVNMHPSLLPRHRGPAPIESQILTEKSEDGVGVSLMLLDAEMDHGPVIAQKKVSLLSSWPCTASQLRGILSREGATLLADTLPKWVSGSIEATEQNHTQATYSKKIEKTDAEIDLTGNAEENFRKILAYNIWPRAYFFADKQGAKIRTVITAASYQNDTLLPLRVIPEGKKEMSWDEFSRYVSS